MARLKYVAALVMLLALPAVAGTPASHYSALTLAATTATKVPTTPLYGRTAVLITNSDTATIWCGADSNVTNSNGTPILAGVSLSVPLGWVAAGQVDIYCYSVAGTAASAVRVWEVQS